MSTESVSLPPPPVAQRRSRPFIVSCSVATLIAAGLLVYSQTDAYASDEGFHLLAAQLIKNGKRPYLDFFFPQTALNAYWTAFWFRIFGDTWRTAHALAALCTSAAVLLIVDYVAVRFPVARWRLAATLAAAFLFGLNIVVFEFGAIAQAYGLCVLLIVAAFRVAVGAVDRKGFLISVLAGFFGGAAAASSLLTAPVAPILLLWSFLVNRAGNRWVKALAFISGVIVAFLPLLRLFVLSPHQVIFNVINFHLYYRQLEWSGALQHDLDVMLGWLDSSQAFVLGALALAGLLYVFFEAEWDRRLRAEFYLCGWLILGLTVHILSAHPTFERYFIFTVPFLTILGTAGLYAIASKLYKADRPLVPTLILGLIVFLALGKAIYDGRDDRKWTEYETVAKKVDEVTPPNGLLLAEEHVYFITRRQPPMGMEHSNSHKLEISAAQAAELHVVTRPDLNREIKAGMFHTVQTCEDDDEIKKLGLPEVYKNRAEIEECSVFWK